MTLDAMLADTAASIERHFNDPDGLAPEPEAPRLARAATITTEAELARYIKDRFGVVIPNTQVCPNHSTPWRAFSEAYFARARVSVWKASRGFGGKSYLLSLLGLTEATTLLADVNVLGGSGEQSERVLEAMSRQWGHPNAPRELLLSDPGKRETKLIGGNKVRALMASTKSVRGPHPQRIRLDEVDEVKITVLNAAMGQTMSKGEIGAQTVLSSTHHYSAGTMTEVLRRAGDKGWPVHEWCWKENLEPHGWLPRAEVEAKRTEIEAWMWQAEYDLQEPSPENRAIVPDAVEAMFPMKLGHHKGLEGEYLELEAPDQDGRYSTGGDWAKKQDHTVIWTFRTDCKPFRLVAFERMKRRPWPVMVGKFDERVSRYPGVAAHDGTGIGDVVAGYMKSDAEGVILVGRDRSDTFSEYIAAIERGECEAPRVESAYTAHKFATVGDLYEGGHPPDEFVAAALAYRAATRGSGFLEFARQEAAKLKAEREGGR